MGEYDTSPPYPREGSIPPGKGKANPVTGHEGP
jgi:hypothetical protein